VASRRIVDAFACNVSHPDTQSIDWNTSRYVGEDAAIIMMRRLLMRLAHQLEEGQDPWAAEHGEVMTLRSAGVLTAKDVSFVEATEPLVRVGTGSPS